MLTIQFTDDGALSKVDQVLAQVRDKMGGYPWTMTYEKNDDGSRSLLLTIEPTITIVPVKLQEPVNNDDE